MSERPQLFQVVRSQVSTRTFAQKGRSIVMRMLNTAAWLLNGLGLALLVLSLMSVPNAAMADDISVGDIGLVAGDGCAFDECSNGCIAQTYPSDCDGTQSSCNNDGSGARNCNSCRCKAKAGTMKCGCTAATI
jgi:hypothetical protein